MLNQNEENYQLLVAVVPNEIKDDLVDALINLECISGFTFNEVGGYSKIHSQYDVAEQVQGYRKLLRFEVVHDSKDASSILAELKPICEKAHARYWIVTVDSMGHF